MLYKQTHKLDRKHPAKTEIFRDPSSVRLHMRETESINTSTAIFQSQAYARFRNATLEAQTDSRSFFPPRSYISYAPRRFLLAWFQSPLQKQPQQERLTAALAYHCPKLNTNSLLRSSYHLRSALRTADGRTRHPRLMSNRRSAFRAYTRASWSGRHRTAHSASSTTQTGASSTDRALTHWACSVSSRHTCYLLIYDPHECGHTPFFQFRNRAPRPACTRFGRQRASLA